MEDAWESHVSPLVMGVGMGEMQAMGEMQQEMNMPHQQDLAATQHPELIHQEIEQDLGREMGRNDMRTHQEGLGGHEEYFSHQVGVVGRKDASGGNARRQNCFFRTRNKYVKHYHKTRSYNGIVLFLMTHFLFI
ncbi:hypothetical protein Zmor_004892 [Zophobas morio]|uniref:Uncharacterized protein n=1 Tax=Zophobas morio TaxID=2755281 RepID=A0AA38MLV3_9CUCU|nr:hypothetical protein Zmor_004892 [Zophobas morio]